MKRDNVTRRHPLAFVVEAADDISYLTTDIDDAHRMRQLPFKDCEELLHNIVESGMYADEYRKFRTENDQDKVSFLRSLASATLIDGVVQTFLDKQKDILNGEFQGTLIEKSKYVAAAKRITRICKEKVYVERNKYS
jgi:dGTPase